jgi:large subunit ribosomal protein L6
MSRIGKKPIPIPRGVEVHPGHGVVRVKGPKGSLLVGLMPDIAAAVDGDLLTLSRANEDRRTRAYHGLSRALIQNAVTGVSSGWKKELEIVGIGYRAEVKGAEVVFHLGYSHPVTFDVPEGISIEVDAKSGRVTVSGIDRQQVGQVAANIRGLRPPEPYKGKGIRYAGEALRMKAGKQGAR